MRVGTDGVSLGAWAPAVGRVLDVGAGCGLIGLMAAQRGAQHVTLLEIDTDGADEAALNAAASPWADRVEVVRGDFLTFEPAGLFDSIVSNPPFFATGEQAPDARRAAARHEGALTPEAFMKRASLMLAPGGTVSVIVPPDRLDSWTFAARLHGLRPQHTCSLVTRPSAPPRRVMVTYGRDGGDGQSVLNINSQEYKEITSPFYL